jgi:hypothetical protein
MPKKKNKYQNYPVEAGTNARVKVEFEMDYEVWATFFPVKSKAIKKAKHDETVQTEMAYRMKDIKKEGLDEHFQIHFSMELDCCDGRFREAVIKAVKNVDFFCSTEIVGVRELIPA